MKNIRGSRIAVISDMTTPERIYNYVPELLDNEVVYYTIRGSRISGDSVRGSEEQRRYSLQ